MLVPNYHTSSFLKHVQLYNKYASDGIIDLDKRLKDQPDFQIFKLEDIVNDTSGILPACRQTPYSITLIRKGDGEQKIGEECFAIEDFTLLIVPSRTVYSSRIWSKDCSGYVLIFSAEFLLNSTISKQCILNRKALKNNIIPFVRLNKGEMTALLRIYEDIFKISKGDRPGGLDMLAVKVLELLIYCDPLIRTSIPDVSPQLYHPQVEKFIALLNKKYYLERGVQYYANELNIHPNYLNFLLKKHNGLSAKGNIDRKLVLESKYLLVNRSLRIKEIAYKLGFNDPNNFSTFFQKYAGSSPAMYRTSLAYEVNFGSG